MEKFEPLTADEVGVIKRVSPGITSAFQRQTLQRLIATIEQQREQIERLRGELLEKKKYGIIPGWRSGLVLSLLCKVITTKRNWTATELRTELSIAGAQATNRQLFNAIGYLVREGLLMRLGHGKYELIPQDGKALASTET